MITNFEEYTHELTKDELVIGVPFIVDQLKKALGKNNAITNNRLRTLLWAEKGLKKRPERIRKIIQWIRLSGILNRVIANSNGYYISIDNDEIQRAIDSQMERIAQQQMGVDALEWQRNNVHFTNYLDSKTRKPLYEGFVVHGIAFENKKDADAYCVEKEFGCCFDELFVCWGDAYVINKNIINWDKPVYDDNGLELELVNGIVKYKNQ